MAAVARKRASKGLLVPPAARPNHSEDERRQWLRSAFESFVAPTPANKRYYLAILELLWPAGHGIPGPRVAEADVRAVIDALRLSEGKDPYRDPFRRMRELQGDEGFTSIIKEGTTYQLTSTATGPKRTPREKLADPRWSKIKATHGHRCAVCGIAEPEVLLSPDHKVPRARNGTNADLNYQPLCQTCNGVKSAVCQGCELVCETCTWAYPETYKPLKIDDVNNEQVRRLAKSKKMDASEVVNKILREFFLHAGRPRKS